jgi:peptidoglycan hydrolase CwlO-like protein
MSFHAIMKLATSEINMKKQNRRLPSLARRLKSAPVLMVIVLLLSGSASIAVVHADTLQQQIDNLNSQNTQKLQSVNDLQLQAKSYQDAISKLQAEISSVQAAIGANEARQIQLQNEIDADQLKLEQQKKVLGEDLKAMYVGGQLTTVEMLATSKDLSSFVDAETYGSAVQNKIQKTLSEITQLQNQLLDQKSQVEQLLATQQAQQLHLASDQSEQNRLLAMNQDQQSTYNQQIAANQKQISALEAQQAAINARDSQQINIPPSSGGAGGRCDVGFGNGGYPLAWCNADQDTLPTIPYSSDPINRECTSFAYWYFTSVEGKPLHVTGNAKDWAYTANRPVDQTPEDGAIGVKTEGPFGHVMIVLALPGETYRGVTAPSGEVLTMSMNYDYQGHFHYSEYAVGSLEYIH